MGTVGASTAVTVDLTGSSFDSSPYPCLEVDLSAIVANYRHVRDCCSGSEVTGVIKSDAYGLGAGPVACALAAAGCTGFWVDDLTEGLALRPVVPHATVFALHGFGVDPVAAFQPAGIIPVLTSLGEVEAAAAEGRRTGHRFPVAINLDTGLGRLGLSETEVERLIERPDLMAPLELKAWVSHLTAFDRYGDPSNDRQRALFAAWTDRLPPAPRSLAASSGALLDPRSHFDIARVGSALFGIQTSDRWQDGLIPAYRLTAPILRVADLPAGREVGYRGAGRLDRPSRIATIDLGYANGIPPAFIADGEAWIGGYSAPFVGGISMTLAMLDVTDLPDGTATVGTRCVVFDSRAPIEPVAERLNVMPNVLLTQIAKATRRLHLPASVSPSLSDGQSASAPTASRLLS